MSDLWLGMLATALIVALVAVIKGLALLDEAVERWQSVRASAAPAPDVLSSSPPAPIPIPPSGLQTDGRQTADRPLVPAITREQMLDAAKVLRAAGLSREKGRAVFVALGLPLDNNLWAQAAPPEPVEDYATPIAGRPTRREYFQDEPALAYTPPPQS